MNVIPFKDLPRGARNLIIYYAIAEPGVIGIVIFNAYLLLTGYSILEVGAIISVASLLTSLLLPLLGYLSDRKVNAKYFVMMTEALIGVSFLLYGFATGPLMILVGRVIFSAAMLFTFASSVYEKELYPKDRLDDSYIWHWLIPSAAGIFSYLAALIYFSLFPNLWAMRLYYQVFGIGSVFYVAYVYLFLPDLPTHPEKTKIRLSGKFVPILLVFLLSGFSTYFIYGLPFDNVVINYFGSGVWVVVLMALLESLIGLSSSYFKTRIPRRVWPNLAAISMAAMGVISLSIFLSSLLLDKERLFPVFLILYVAHTFFWPLWHMSFRPLLLSSVPEKLRGTVFSSMAMINRLATIPLAFAIGVLVSTFGTFSPAFLSAVFSVSTVALLLHIKKMKGD